MKYLLLVATLVITALTFKANAQEKGIFHNNQKINTTPISSVKVTAGASMYLTGIGSIKTKAVIANTTSRNQIKVDSLTFTMNFGEEIVDDFNTQNAYNGSINSPNDLLLYRLEKKTKERRLLVGTAGTFTGAAVGLDASESIQFTYTSLGNGLYEVKLPNTLRNGEYAFVNSQWTGVATKVWAFTATHSNNISSYERMQMEKRKEKEARKAAKRNKN